jgi:hypothetical protein
MATLAHPPDFAIEPKAAPWETAPYGVVTLLDMLKLYADFFVQEFGKLHELEVRLAAAPAQAKAPPPQCVEVYAEVGTYSAHLAEQRLSSAFAKCARIHQTLEERRMNATYGELAAWLREVRERIEDDLRNELFLHIWPDDAKLYENPKDGWEQVIGRFSRVRHDVEECSKCFALGRYSAALFHVLLVAEFGVIKVAELFGVAGDKPGWGALDRLQRINDKKWNDKTPLEQQHAEFLKNLLPLAYAIKDSWRHKISHVDNKLDWMDTDFSPEVAREIISATRGFMRRLAQELPK